MIQTKVSQLGANEHEVRVQLPKSEYDRVYDEQARKIARSVRLPGFRPGKAPLHVVRRQFGPRIAEDTISHLIQEHYVEALEQSGLTPAVQPRLDIPAEQPEDAFVFTMQVATWPEVEVRDLKKLKFERTQVTVEPEDIDAVVERLRKSQVRFEIEEGRKAEKGDQLHIDFEGFLGEEPFEGGKGENVALVLGEGRFVEGFEEQLEGAVAGEDRELVVTFPEDYPAEHLAGRKARFAVHVRSVARPVHAENDDELAAMLGFQDAGALRDDIATRLGEEAEQASEQATREAMFEALLAANPVELPELLIEEDMRATAERVLANLRRQGMAADRSLLQDENFRAEIRRRSERGLKLSVLLQAVRRQAGIELADEDVEAEIQRRARRYPEEQREQFVQWLKGQPEQMEAVRDAALEAKVIAHIVEQAKTTVRTMSLGEWQKSQEGGDE